MYDDQVQRQNGYSFKEDAVWEISESLSFHTILSSVLDDNLVSVTSFNKINSVDVQENKFLCSF